MSFLLFFCLFVTILQNLEIPANHAPPWTVSVTVEHESEDSPPNSNNQTLHTYLPSERTVVADVHHTTPSVFEVFNIRGELDGTIRYVSQIDT